MKTSTIAGRCACPPYPARPAGRPRGPGGRRPAAPGPGARGARRARRSPATSATRAAAGRNVAYVGIGAAVITRRLWESRSTARYERHIRSAEAARRPRGGPGVGRRSGSKFLKDRHARRADLVELPLKVARELPKIAAGVLGLLVAIGILLAIASRNSPGGGRPGQGGRAHRRVGRPSRSPSPTGRSCSARRGSCSASCAGPGAATRTPPRPVVGGGQAGRRGRRGLVITADTIVLALQHLPVPALRQAFKNGWTPLFHTLPVRDGRGYSAVFSLPLGVTAGMIADQRPVLARNVHRAEVEVWPSDAEKAGTGPAGIGGGVDRRQGRPVQARAGIPAAARGHGRRVRGRPGRGDAARRGDRVPVVGNNFVAGGQMGQGKSNACRVVMLGCALDPLAELTCSCSRTTATSTPTPRGWRSTSRASRTTRSPRRSPGCIELYAEVARREGRLAELGAKKVTRGAGAGPPGPAAHRGAVQRVPRAVRPPGARRTVAAELATKTAKRARKTGITLGVRHPGRRARKRSRPSSSSWSSVNVLLLRQDVAVQRRIPRRRVVRRRASARPSCGPAGTAARAWSRACPTRSSSCCAGTSSRSTTTPGYDAAAEVIARAVAQVAPGHAGRGRPARCPRSRPGTCWTTWTRCSALSG